MTNEITNSQDIIDSRDIIARIADLEDDVTLSITEIDELEALKALAEQCKGYGDWEHGEALIRDSYFEQYAQEMAENIGAIDHGARWPLSHIDWPAAADELRADYMEVDFDGEAYQMRT